MLAQRLSRSVMKFWHQSPLKSLHLPTVSVVVVVMVVVGVRVVAVVVVVVVVDTEQTSHVVSQSPAEGQVGQKTVLQWSMRSRQADIIILSG